jgi:hypothetical protein
MKPSRQSVSHLVISLGEMIPFFPKGPLADELMVEAILEFVSTEEQLEWLARAAIRQIRKYEGVQQLRQLFCTQFAPADGIQPVFETTENFLAHEALLETQFRQREMEENDRVFEEYKRQAALNPPAEPLLLPEVKHLPDQEMGTSVVVVVPRPFKRSLADLEAELAITPKSPARSEEERLRAVLELVEALQKGWETSRRGERC